MMGGALFTTVVSGVAELFDLYLGPTPACGPSKEPSFVRQYLAMAVDSHVEHLYPIFHFDRQGSVVSRRPVPEAIAQCFWFCMGRRRETKDEQGCRKGRGQSSCDVTGFCHVVALPDETIRVRYTHQGVVDQDTSSGLVHRVLTKDADIDQLSRDPVAEPADGVASSKVLLKALCHDD